MPCFFVTALSKPGAVQAWDEQHPGVYLEHLETSVPAIKLEGLLFDRNGARCGIFAMVEGDDFAEVDRWVAASPYKTAGLYDHIDIHRADIQAGSITE